jgi:sRNA-binding protein
MVALLFDPAAERAKQAETRRHIRRLLRDAGVTVFADYSPLAVGIRAPLGELLAGEVEPHIISGFLRYHVSRIPYLEAVVRGEPRRDLNGVEVGPPTEEQRQFAEKRLAWIAARKAAKKAGATQ